MAERESELSLRPRPPSRHPVPAVGEEPATDTSAPAEPSEASPSTVAATGAERTQPAPRRRPAHEGKEDHPKVGPDDHLSHLAVRVRRPLDERLSDLVHELRREGIRTSKAELIELLLWELPARPGADFRARLGSFRQGAPRETAI